MLSAALGVLGRYLGRIILTTAAAVLIYVAIKVVKKIFNVSSLAALDDVQLLIVSLATGIPGGVRNVDRHARTSLVSSVCDKTMPIPISYVNNKIPALHLQDAPREESQGPAIPVQDCRSGRGVH